MPPGSGLETTLSHHHAGVMTYSHYVNGSIFSVPKFEVVHAKNCNNNAKASQGSDNLVETVYGLVKSFLG